eukprot:TRINITY_DN4999_c0_g2_i1.p1 TRINITY_DN4999_c0_g2~~TRINITY_DN4999_c0_g2_i1.p1  ORF type:complete len:139 (-),score=11.80 TRINITY_DN4999_c0_g2_i1:217-633(-)
MRRFARFTSLVQMESGNSRFIVPPNREGKTNLDITSASLQKVDGMIMLSVQPKRPGSVAAGIVCLLVAVAEPVTSSRLPSSELRLRKCEVSVRLLLSCCCLSRLAHLTPGCSLAAQPGFEQRRPLQPQLASQLLPQAV